MKAEHRHELQRNTLAEGMKRLVEGMKSNPRPTSTLIWVFVLVGLGIFAVWQYMASASQSRNVALWTQIDAATHDPREGLGPLESIGRQYGNTLPGRTARFQVARLQFQRGQADLTSRRNEEAAKTLQEARDLYRRLTDECADAPLLAQEAMMSVAKADESLAGIDTPGAPEKDLKQALQEYQRLAKAYPKGDLGQEAGRRAKELEDNLADVTKFYQQLYDARASKPSGNTKGS